MSRLAQIYKSEKSKGGGLTSTIGKRFLEKIDIRQMFDQSGIMAAMIPTLFKNYNATDDSSWNSKSNSSKIKSGKGKRIKDSPTNVGNELSKPMNVSELTASMSLVAVNTFSIDKKLDPIHDMAKSTNVINKNIKKMLKLMGGTPTDHANKYFDKSGANSPTKVVKIDPRTGKPITRSDQIKDSGTDLLGNIAGGIGSIFKGIGSAAGMASIGLGIGGFLAGIGAGGAAVNAMGGAQGVKDILVALGEGLNAFNTQSMIGLGALLTGTTLFSAVGGPMIAGQAALGISAIGLGLGLFLAGLSTGGKLAELANGASGLKEVLIAIGTGLEPLSKLDGKNLMGIGDGMYGLGKGILALYGSKAADSIVDGVKNLLKYVNIGDGANKKTIFEQIANDLKAFDDVNAQQLNDTAKGIDAITDALRAMGAITDDELEQAARARGIALGAPVLLSPSSNSPSKSQKSSSDWGGMIQRGLGNAAEFALDGMKQAQRGLGNVGQLGIDYVSNKLLTPSTPSSTPSVPIGEKIINSLVTPAAASTLPSTSPTQNNGRGLSETGSADEAMKFFMKKGWKEHQAAGIVGNLKAESEFLTSAVGDGGKAYGIAQWHPPRQKTFEEVMKVPIRESNFKQQLEFVDWELKNSHRNAGEMLAQTNNPADAAAVVDAKYEISAGFHRQRRIDNAYALLNQKYIGNLNGTNASSLAGNPTISGGNLNQLTSDSINAGKLPSATPITNYNIAQQIPQAPQQSPVGNILNADVMDTVLGRFLSTRMTG